MLIKMPPACDDETEGRNPNEPRRPPVPGDAGFTLTLVGGPLHGRDARLRDSSCRLWYSIDQADRPTVISATDAPKLEPGQHIVGYYAFREADETAVWHRAPEPPAHVVTTTPAAMPDPFRWIITVCAIVAALALVVLARRPLPGRYTVNGTSGILDTETGVRCRVGRVGATPDCAPAPPATDSGR